MTERTTNNPGGTMPQGSAKDCLSIDDLMKGGQSFTYVENEPQDKPKAAPGGQDLIGQVEQDRQNHVNAEQRAREEKLSARLRRRRVTRTTEFPEYQNLLKQGDLEFMPMGELHVLAAHKKQGKTSAVAVLASMVLGSRFAGVEALKDDATVLIFDTEQHCNETKKICEYVYNLCGGCQDIDQRLIVYNIMGDNPDDQMDLVEYGCMIKRPSLIVVDGIRDLFLDPDDKGQISDRLTRLKVLTRDVGCAVLCVIHYNKNDEQLRYTLGTELGNKLFDLFTMSKNKSGDLFLFTLQGHEDSRGLPMEPVRFTRDKNLDGLPIPFNGLTESEQKQCAKAMEVCTFIHGYITEHPGANTTTLYDAIKSHFRGCEGIKASRNDDLKKHVETALHEYKDIVTKPGLCNATCYYISKKTDESNC